MATVFSPPLPPSLRRRLPPPCWSPLETVSLIDAYKHKWYSLRRGNLRANRWQEVADHLASRSPVSPPKTAVQCRHKMEKLRMRYRSQIHRSSASSWVHFHNMHSLERGPNPSSSPSPSPSSNHDEEDDCKSGIKRIHSLTYNTNNNHNPNLSADYNGSANGFRIKIPGRMPAGPSSSSGKEYSNLDEISGQYPNFPNFPNYGGAHKIKPSKVLKEGFVGRGEMGKRGGGEVSRKSNEHGDDDSVGDFVAAIQALGEGFMRVEKTKMDMVRQIEEMRMETELKRTQMILESQHRIVEAFAKAMSERTSKRARRNSTPPDC